MLIDDELAVCCTLDDNLWLLLPLISVSQLNNYNNMLDTHQNHEEFVRV